MLSFLSDGWIDALHRAASNDPALADLARGVSMAVEHEVTGGPAGEVRYHVRFDEGTVSVAAGPAPQATIRFSTDHETAAAIASGRGSAQRAFMSGRLRVGGDLQVLLAHRELFEQLHDVFGPVRAETEVPADVEAPASDHGDA